MADSDTDTLKKDLEKLRRDFQALATDVRTTSEKRAQAGVDGARATYEDLRNEATRRTKEVGAEIESRPYTSIFAAFGLGLLIGKLFDR